MDRKLLIGGGLLLALAAFLIIRGRQQVAAGSLAAPAAPTNVPIPAGVAVATSSLPTGVPSGSRLIGTVNADSIYSPDGTTFYFYNRNKGTVQKVGLHTAQQWIANPGFKPAR